MSLVETIQEINRDYSAVLNELGAPGVDRFFTEDVELLPPGPDNIRGAVAAAAYWAAATEHFRDVHLVTEDVVPLGDAAAREIGTYRGAPRAANGEPISGKYVFIWRKVGADWKIATDIWTSHSGHT